MTKVITSPDKSAAYGPSLFLAGGITGCSDWQQYIIEELKKLKFSRIVINPRRKDGFKFGTRMAKNQIKWEWERLQDASCISFWFPSETLCPITLFELGRWTHSANKADGKTILVGVDPKYLRKLDVEVQLNLECPEIKIVYTLDGLIEQMMSWDTSDE